MARRTGSSRSTSKTATSCCGEGGRRQEPECDRVGRSLATVVRVRGKADEASVAAERASMAAAAVGASLVVVDLDETTAATPQSVRDLIAALGADRKRVHVVARRNSTVTLLAPGADPPCFGVHRTVDDAIAAHRAAMGTRLERGDPSARLGRPRAVGGTVCGGTRPSRQPWKSARARPPDAPRSEGPPASA